MQYKGADGHAKQEGLLMACQCLVLSIELDLLLFRVGLRDLLPQSERCQ